MNTPALVQVLPGERPLELLILLGAMALAPLALVTLTSFLKVVVVLSVLRSALGVPQVPPNAAVTGLALLVTLLVMQPVAAACWRRWQDSPAPRGPEETLAAGARAAEPLRAFLARFAAPGIGAPSPCSRRGPAASPRPGRTGATTASASSRRPSWSRSSGAPSRSGS